MTQMDDVAAPAQPRPWVRLRWAAAPWAALALALNLAYEGWISPGLSAEQQGQGGPAAMAALLVGLGGPLAGYGLMLRRAGRRPATFVLDRAARRFVAPTGAMIPGIQAIFALGITGRSAGMQLAHPGAMGGYLVPLAAGLVVIAAGGLAVDRPWLALAVDGVVIQGFLRRRTLAWADIPAAGGRKVRKVEMRLHVNEAFLARAINNYREDPDRRAAIGTDAELARLTA
jgi:hypothetical protein